MSSPPGRVPDTDPATSRETERQDQFLNPRIVAREAAKVLACRGVEVRPAVLRRLVSRFIRNGYTTLAEVEPFILGYLDPTGEQAVKNVMRASR